MNSMKNLVEQQSLMYESRLKHIDELLKRADHNVPVGDDEYEAALDEVRRTREELAQRVDELKHDRPENLQQEVMQKAGPMAVWDAIAQRLENLLEKIEGPRA